jgi:chromosome segregation protein
LILEEAAGVSGLHSRRHEAELRLKGAEENLLRLEDVMGQIDAQVESLRRQARQATRYRGLAAEIRRHEALAKWIELRERESAFAEAERRLEGDVREVAERTRRQAEAARLQAIAATAMPALRDAEARAGAALHRLTLARDTLDSEEKRAHARVGELQRRVEQLSQDHKREESLTIDAAQVDAKLEAEDRALAERSDGGEAEAEARARRDDVEQRLAIAEAALAEAQAASSDVNARRNALTATVTEEARRLARFELELSGLQRERRALPGVEDEEAAFHEAAATLDMLGDELAEAEEQALEAEAANVRAHEAEAAARVPLNEAERRAQRLETEVRTLTNLLGSSSGGRWPPVIDEIVVARGYEVALGVALSDDLEASLDAEAPTRWAGRQAESDDPVLPAGVESLAEHVDAPAALSRRLAQIGFVSQAEGKALSALLKPGQRLVSGEGDLWRWDGFVAVAGAPTPTARRLVEKNRLGDLSDQAETARQAAEQVKSEAMRAQAAMREAANAEAAARQRARATRAASDAARDRLASAERRRALILTRLSTLDEGIARSERARDEALERKNAADAAMEALAPSADLALNLERARANAAQARSEFAEARASEQNLTREHEARATRRRAIAEERRSWAQRRAKADAHIEEIAERRRATIDELEGLDDAPAQFLRQRRALLSQLTEAEATRKTASDERAIAETALIEADHEARAALDAMGSARESRAASEQRREGARQRRDQLLHVIATELGTNAAGLAALAGVKAGDPAPDSDGVARRLDTLKQERERLGAVNLRADDELAEVEASREKMFAEREDLSEAIKRLRQAIHNLNQEGRERLVAAFDVVNTYFGELFATLFEGGTAQLQLVESDDPLEAGLELLAQPPGKKPQTLTLLSGGEQALTAMSLIFAVFLTNPSPICVLDEVDAPLDDYNVERFCDLLDEMSRRSDTRFVTITHNPITMARMDRLFGVTMAERGVSQIVSVDLATAEKFLEAS